MRVDFYELGSIRAEKAIAQLADKALGAGQRLLVVSDDEAQLARISEALWSASGESFLAHGRAGAEHEARQPILLSTALQPSNGARIMAIADGAWREADAGIERTLYLFEDAKVRQARECWSALGSREGFERHIWKRKGGKWVEGR